MTGKYAEPFREKYTEYVKLLIEINVLVNGRMTPAIAFGRAAEKYVKQNFGKASLEFAGYVPDGVGKYTRLLYRTASSLPNDRVPVQGIHMEAILNVNEKKLAYAKSDDPKVSKKAMAMATKKEAYDPEPAYSFPPLTSSQVHDHGRDRQLCLLQGPGPRRGVVVL